MTSEEFVYHLRSCGIVKCLSEAREYIKYSNKEQYEESDVQDAFRWYDKVFMKPFRRNRVTADGQIMDGMSRLGVCGCDYPTKRPKNYNCYKKKVCE